jgi:hypothetical protein
LAHFLVGDIRGIHIEHVQLTPLAGERQRHVLLGARLARIPADRQKFPLQAALRPVETVLRPAGDSDLGAFEKKLTRRLEPDPARAAGDQCKFAL